MPTGLSSCRSFAPNQSRPNAKHAPITAGRRGDVPVLSGVNTCKDRSCAECAQQRAHEDAREVAGVTSRLIAKGWSVFMLTSTIRHAFGDDFRTLRDGMDEAWNATFSGRWLRNLRALCGDVLFVRRFESTFGANGHHPHYHVLLFVKDEPSASALGGLDFEEWFTYQFDERFAERVERALGVEHVPFGAYAVRFERAANAETAARYVAKVGFEIAAQTTKTDGSNPSMPFGVLGLVRELREHEEDLAKRGVVAHDAIARRAVLEGALRNWYAGSKSTTVLSWSKRLTPIREEVEAEEAEKKVEVTAFVPAGYSSRVLAREGFSVLFFDALASGASADVLRSIFVASQVEERRARAGDAWDREQRRWERIGDEWHEREGWNDYGDA